MKKARKILTMALCAVLLVCISVGATVAYLTASTGEVKNTFTVGSVTITLDEADVDEYGDQIMVENEETEETGDMIPAPRTDNNEYKLIPGHNYLKDPTVHVQEGSEQCYVFVKVVDGIADIQDESTVADQMTTNGWQQLVVNGADVENVYFYGMTNTTAGDIVDARSAQVDLQVFASFKLKGDADVADYDGKTITVDAYAVQADGFANAAAAWAAAVPTWEPATQG